MEQLNELARTFSKGFNEIQREGTNLKGGAGMDLFTATNKINGRTYTFGPLIGSDDASYYDYSTFNSQTGGYFEEVPDEEPLYGSYYFMTAANFTINPVFFEDTDLFSTTTDIVNGTENNDIVDRLIAIMNDKTLFKQGTPDNFFQTMVAEVGIDMKKATTFADSQTDILKTITNQRLSVSGVDIDEEAMNLVRFQNAYNLSAKVISVMDEIYDRLINYMGA